MQKLKRIFLISTILGLANCLTYSAHSGPSDRFELRKVKGGYLHFDRKAGAVSFCRRKELKWQCLDIGANSNPTIKPMEKISDYKVYLIGFSRGIKKLTRRYSKFIEMVRTTLP